MSHKNKYFAFSAFLLTFAGILALGMLMDFSGNVALASSGSLSKVPMVVKYDANGKVTLEEVQVDYTEADEYWSAYVPTTGYVLPLEGDFAIIGEIPMQLPSRVIYDLPKVDESWVVNLPDGMFTIAKGWHTTFVEDGVEILVPFYQFDLGKWDAPSSFLSIRAVPGDPTMHKIMWKDFVFVLPTGSPIEVDRDTYMRIVWVDPNGYLPVFSYSAPDLDLGSVRWFGDSLATIETEVQIPFAAVSADKLSVFIGIQNVPMER